MTKVTAKNIAHAVKQVSRMSLHEKEAEFDIVHNEQPNLLASVIVQHRMGNTLEQIDVLLHLLLVIHLALKDAGIILTVITEDQQEKQLRRLVGHIKFADGLDAASFSTALTQFVEHDDEKWLFAHALNTVVEAGFPQLKNENSKYLTLCGLNLVQCVAGAIKRR